MSAFDPKRVRGDIPQLRRRVHDKPLIYLDSGSSSLTPRSVIESMSRYYEMRHANVHRGVYQTAEEATATYEGARVAVGQFIGAPHPADEVVFTKNTTEGFNLFAHSWGATHLRRGDVIVLTEMEHHANIVPWFQLRDAIGIEIRFLGVTDDYRLDLSNLDRVLSGARLLSLTAMSNVLGTITPLAALTKAAHDAGAIVAVDGAQIVGHEPVNVAALDVDAFIFSAHKLLGPTGIGAVWVRREVLDTMPPFLGGGGMIADVSLAGFTPAEGVSRFEAGTPPIAESAGFHAAVRYMTGLGMDNVASYERHLTADAIARLQSAFGDKIAIIGPRDVVDRGPVISLDVHGVHAHDVAQVLDEFGVCVRPGHHCAKPLMKRYRLQATARASFGPYSLPGDIDVLIAGLERALEIFG
jgi:cysteine desulfurase / selenocysteine lyase